MNAVLGLGVVIGAILVSGVCLVANACGATLDQTLLALAAIFSASLVTFMIYLCFDGDGGLTTWKRRAIFVAIAGFVLYRAFNEAFTRDF